MADNIFIYSTALTTCHH